MIKYFDGYKYHLQSEYVLHTGIRQSGVIDAGFISLHQDGKLFIRKGYAWDGSSGPAIDTKNSMRASLVHDALYQLMRLGELDRDFRGAADWLYYAICREDGMSSLRAWIQYKAVRHFAESSASPENRIKVLTAP